MKTNAWKRNSRGFTLLEVLIGIVIFALGMMALAQLQTSLARNSADAIVHATRSSLKEMGDKLSDDERKEIDSAIEGVEEAMKGDDKAAI